MELNEKIRHLRTSLGLTLEDVGNAVGVGKSTVLKWEKGDIANMRRDKILGLAKVLKTTPAYLMGWDSEPNKEIPSVANIFPIPGFTRKPRLGTIACGKPIFCAEDAEEFDDVPVSVHCDFTLRCQGDSMINSRIFDGDIVYIRAQPQVENGEIAAVRIGDEATLKKVYYTGKRITLRAANPLYEDMVYSGSELDEIEILGKAVAFTSQIR